MTMRSALACGSGTVQNIYIRGGRPTRKAPESLPLSVLNDAPYLAVWSGYFLSVGVATFASTLLLATRLLTFLFLDLASSHSSCPISLPASVVDSIRPSDGRLSAPRVSPSTPQTSGTCVVRDPPRTASCAPFTGHERSWQTMPGLPGPRYLGKANSLAWWVVCYPASTRWPDIRRWHHI
jgi:hypothetical protein